MTIVSVLKQGINFGLSIKQVEDVIQTLIGISRERLFLYPDVELAKGGYDACIRAFYRLLQGEPLFYVLGMSPFCGREFLVDRRCLIPRPETEFLVELCLDRLKHVASGVVFDVGTGSGVIGITLAVEKPELQVVCSDNDQGVLDLTRQNVFRFFCEKRVRVEYGDLLLPLINTTNLSSLQAIVANLPYIGTEEFSYIEPSVEQFEPPGALFGGRDGLDVYRAFFDQLYNFPIRPPFVFIEIGQGQYNRIRQYILDMFDTVAVCAYKDFAGIDRVVEIHFN